MPFSFSGRPWMTDSGRNVARPLSERFRYWMAALAQPRPPRRYSAWRCRARPRWQRCSCPVCAAAWTPRHGCPAELAASALLHDGADSAGIALQLTLHLLKELQTGADRVEPDTGVRGLLLQGLAPLRSGAAAQTVAVDAVLRGRDIGLRFGELLLCGLERALCLCTAALRRLQILCQLGLPLRALGKTLFHGGQVRAGGRRAPRASGPADRAG